MHRYHVTTRDNAGALREAGTLPLEQAIHELALPIDEAADFEEMTFRQHGKTITLTRCPDPEPEPLTAQVLLTYRVSDGKAREGLRSLWNDGSRSVFNPDGSAVLISAELLPTTLDAPAPENAFLAACERVTNGLPAIEHLSKLLYRARMTHFPEQPGEDWTIEEQLASEGLLVDLRAACDRAQGKPLPGVKAKPKCFGVKYGHVCQLSPGHEEYHWNQEIGRWYDR
jgi:hypothetical protein